MDCRFQDNEDLPSVTVKEIPIGMKLAGWRRTQRFQSIWLQFLLVIFLLTISACSAENVIEYFISPTPSVTSTPTQGITLIPSDTPSPSPTNSPTLTPTNSPTTTSTPTETQTVTPTSSDTPTPGPSLIPSRTLVFTRTTTSTRTQTPTPSITLTPTQTYTPSITPTPTSTFTSTPTETATITLTPEPASARLRIRRPGWMSRVLSPIELEAIVSPGENGMVYLALIGEDSRKIVYQELNHRSSLNRTFSIYPKIDFAIPGVVETARLELSVNDIFGRKIAITSVDLVLLSMGTKEMNPMLSHTEPYIVRYPFEGQTIKGGSLLVSGVAHPVNNNPLIIELINEQNNIVASASITVPQPYGNLSHTPFTVDIPYTLSAVTPIRLTLRQESAGRIPGNVALSSITINLEP